MSLPDDAQRLADRLDRSMVHLSGGTFTYGLTPEQKRQLAADEGVHPDMLGYDTVARPLEVAPFWLDRYPVTRGQFLRFMRETGHTLPYGGWQVGWLDLVTLDRLDDPDRLRCPMTGVNARDALAYAQWVGKRLPTDAEWEFAARGPANLLYPWGNEPSSQLLLDGARTFDSAIPVGSRPDLDSPFGIADMAGNVPQWVKVTVPATSVDGSAVDGNPYVLAGSSLLHRRPITHRVTRRMSWSDRMRIYNSGFRCAGDEAPRDPVDEPLPAEDPSRLIRVVTVDDSARGREPIRLEPENWPTLRVHVPWFPEGMWVVDIPEGHWGPFPGANDWPQAERDVWQTDWHVSDDGTRARYTRQKDGGSLEVVVQAQGDTVTCRIVPTGIGSVSMMSVCVKTLNPLFSSQERLTQYRIDGDRLVGVDQLPLPPGRPTSLSWHLEAPLQHGAVVTRSHTGRGWFVMMSRPGSEAWGNGWPHCTHLGGPALTVEDESIELKLVYMIGSDRDVIDRVGTLSSS